MQLFYWLLIGFPDCSCEDERSGHQYTSCKIGSHHIQCALSVSASFTSSSYERDHNDCLWIIKPASILCPVVPWATMYLPSEIKWTVHLGKTIGITPVLINLWDFFFLLLDLVESWLLMETWQSLMSFIDTVLAVLVIQAGDFAGIAEQCSVGSLAISPVGAVFC